MSWKGIFLRAGIDISDNTTTYGTETDVIYRLTSALTTGTIRGLTNTVTMTAASTGNIVEAFRSAISANVKTGAWANAIVGSINYSTSGAAHGMAAAIAAEMIPPNGSLSRGALYALDVVFGCGASSTWNSAGPVAFMRFDNWGTKAHFSANAFFFHLVGETGATGGLLSLNSRTLRVRIGSTTKYLYLSDTENDLGAMAVDSITLASDVTTAITISGNTTNSIVISGTSTTALNISGATTTDIQLSEGTTLIDAAANGGSCTLTQDAIILVGGGYGKIQFGGATDWGTGATGTLIDGTGWDWVTQTVGYTTSGALATACAAAYHVFTVNQTTHTTASSFFGTWTELYFIADCVLTGAANAAAVWGQVEGAAAFTTPDSGDFVAAGYFNMKSGGLVTLTTGSSLNGLRVKGEVSSVTGSGIFAAIEVLAVTTDWTYGLYVSNTTTGIYIGSATTGINIAGTVTTGIDFTSATLAPDPNRTNSAIAIGDRLGAKTITMEAAVDHLDPFQMNLLIDGANPTDGSTINGMYQLISGDPDTAMASLRLKCTDFNVVVKRNIKDAYCYQGEVDFTTNAVTVGGETAALGLVMNCASAVTGNVRGIIISMQGAGLPDGASSIGIELRNTGTTLGEGIRIMGTPQITRGIVFGNPAGAAGEGNEAPVSAFYFPAGPSADEGPVRNSAKSGDGDGSIQIKVGSGTKWIQFWDAVS